MSETTKINKNRKPDLTVLNLNPFGDSIPPTFTSILESKGYFKTLPKLSALSDADEITKIQVENLIQTLFESTAKLSINNTVRANYNILAYSIYNMYHHGEFKYTNPSKTMQKLINKLIDCGWISERSSNCPCLAKSKDSSALKVSIEGLLRHIDNQLIWSANYSLMFDINYYLLSGSDNLKFDTICYGSNLFRHIMDSMNSELYKAQTEYNYDRIDLEEAYNILSTELSIVCLDISNKLNYTLNELAIYATQLASSVDLTDPDKVKLMEILKLK